MTSRGWQGRAEDRLATAPGYARLESAGGMAGLAVRSVRSALTPPFSWGPDLMVESSLTMRRCLPPLILSVTVFSIGLVITTISGLLTVLGTIDRTGGGLVTGTPREAAYWVTSMIFAGAVGSAMTADLAARKVRDELDALTVLGVDHLKSLIVPRILALALMAPVLGVIAVFIQVSAVYVVNPLIVPNATHSDYLASAAAFMTTADMASLLLKLVVTGVFVGVVCCYKGITAQGGAEGVGRAVNQAVLITFLGLWVMNSLWNAVLLAGFPDFQTLRG